MWDALITDQPRAVPEELIVPFFTGTAHDNFAARSATPDREARVRLCTIHNRYDAQLDKLHFVETKGS
jgi:hypothetical protein